MLVRPPIEVLLQPDFWDEMLDTGFREVVVGYLAFLQEAADGDMVLPKPEDARPRVLEYYEGKGPRFTAVPAIEPDPSLYQDLVARPPSRPEQFGPQARSLSEALRLARSKGIILYCSDDKAYFANIAGGEDSPVPTCWSNPDNPGYIVARTRDYLRVFPEFSGILLDGPDYKWEIAPGARDDLFLHFCTCEHCQAAARSMGLDLLELKAALGAFKSELMDLSEDKAEKFLVTTTGLFAAVDWWLSNPTLLDLLRFRYATIERYQQTVYEGIKAHLPELQIGASSRTPAYSALTGHSLKRRHRYMDFQLPKLYLWPGMQPGFRYTVVQYVDTLTSWNPGLSRETATRVVERLMGITVPDDYPVQEFDRPAPASFYEGIATDEIRKMMAFVGDPEQTVPWVGMEHFVGPQLTPDELRHLLSAMERNGMTRFIFFRYETITDPVWDVLREFTVGA